MTRTTTTFSPPIPEAYRWLDGVDFAPDRPLMNVSQAAPVEAPTRALREAMAQAVLDDPAAHLYGPVLGLPALRSELAQRTSTLYGGAVSDADIAITSGCNEAFAAAMLTLTSEGDEVILPTPWYFNHKMWLDMAGVRAVPLPTGADLLPDPEQAARLISPRTRAIAIVSPNNPAGVEYPPELLQALYDLAKSRGIALVLDETYRDFHSADGSPHALFSDPDWRETLIHLYSFSKAYRLTGHRVGALATSPKRLGQVEKFLDTVTICPAQVGQIGALWGLRHLGDWLASERAEILARRAAMEQGFAGLSDRGWQLKGLGAYFAYAAHPFDMPADVFARRLVRDAGILLLPATMFVPQDDPHGARHLRIAFANLDRSGIAGFFERLAALSF